MSLKQAVRTKVSETYTETQMDLSRVTNLELTWQRMRMVIGLQIPIF